MDLVKETSDESLFCFVFRAHSADLYRSIPKENGYDN